MRKKSNGKPSVLLSKVPPLREICDALGFRSSKEANAFTEFAHKWRKGYITVDNRPGTDLVEWKLPKTQDDLTTMSKTFLYEAGNGKKFWPYFDDPGDKLCFPNDEDRLIDLLKQLFWKQNRYAANNQHYAKDKEARDQFRNTSTVSDTHFRQPSMVSSGERPTPSIPVPSIEDTQIIVNGVVMDTAQVAIAHHQRSDEAKLNVLRATSRNSVTAPDDDIYIIQDDDPLPASPRALPHNNHHDDQPNIPIRQSLDKPLLETTSRSTSKRPSQPTLYVSPYTVVGGDERSLKRPKVSDAEYPESFSSDFGSPRRVSDRKRIPRDIAGTVSSAEVDKFLVDDRDTVIGGDIPASQVRNGSSRLRLRPSTKKKHLTNAPNESKAKEEVGGERARSLNDATQPPQRQSPPALSSLPTPPVVSNHIPSSSSPPAHLSPLAASTTQLESRPKHSPPSMRNSPLTKTSPPPTKSSCTPAAPLAKAPLLIPFHILQHVDGVTRKTFWEAGRFGNKTLEEFLGDLAEKLKCRPGDITTIKLVLRLGSREIDTDVNAGRADVWDMMKVDFKDEIRMAKVRGVGMIKVLIEPVMTERDGLKWGGDGEGEEDEIEL